MPGHMAAVASDNGWRYAKGGLTHVLGNCDKREEGTVLAGLWSQQTGKWSRQRIGWGKEENGGQREEGINERSRRRARSEVVGKRQDSGGKHKAGEGGKG